MGTLWTTLAFAEWSSSITAHTLKPVSFKFKIHLCISFFKNSSLIETSEHDF